MLDHQDLKWIATTSTELNSILQQISRYSDLARRHKGEHNYIELLAERVEMASKKAQALFDRVTSNILENTAVKAAGQSRAPHAPFTVLPPPLPVGRASGAAPRNHTGVEQLSPAKPQAQAQVQQKPDRETATRGIPSDIQVKNAKGNRELVLL